MATEVNQNYFAWSQSQEESSVQDISQGTTQLFGHGSISFGRFDLESLEWEKWSVFTNDKRHEEFGKFNGLVAKKKAYFEEYFKRVRELKALQQQNQQTELNLDYSGDGSDSSQTGEDETTADHEDPTGSGILVDDSSAKKIPAISSEHEVCHSDHENGSLVNEISSSSHSSSVAGLQQIGKQARGNVTDSTYISMQNSYLSQDDPGMAQETMLTSKRTISKEPLIGQATKIIPKTAKMASNNSPAQSIIPKGPCSGKPGVKNQIGGSDITGLRRPSSAASQRPSTREQRPVNRDASKKPAEVTIPFRSSTSERRSATRELALQHANNTTSHRPSTPVRRPITQDSASKQSNAATSVRPSTANRRVITKELAAKQSNIATSCRPSTADKRLATKDLTPKQFNIGSPHRPLTGERRPTTSCRPSTGKQRTVTREGAHKRADDVTLCRPSTAERRPVTKDVVVKPVVVPPCRPSTAERRPTARNVASKVVPSCRPSTAERRPVTKESALKNESASSLRWPLTPDASLSKKCETSTPQRPSTGERRPISNDSAHKWDQNTPVRLRAVPNCSKGAMFSAVTPRKAVTPYLVKSNKQGNISYAKVKVEHYVDGEPETSLSNFPPRKMLTSNVRDGRVLDSFRKPNKQGRQERVQAQALAPNSTASLQTASVKTKAPIPPPPPPPPHRPSCIERKPNANILTASGRKAKASTPRWH